MNILGIILAVILAILSQIASLFSFYLLRVHWFEGDFPNTGYNLDSYIYICLTLLGHLITFWAIHRWILNDRNIPHRIMRICVLLALVATQVFWRGMSNFHRMDCDDNCVSSIPTWHLDSTTTYVVVVGLLILVFIFGRKQSIRIK